MPRGRPRKLNGLNGKDVHMTSMLTSLLADYMHRLPVEERMRRLANFNQVVLRKPRGSTRQAEGQ